MFRTRHEADTVDVSEGIRVFITRIMSAAISAACCSGCWRSIIAAVQNCTGCCMIAALLGHALAAAMGTFILCTLKTY
jgi:hypothetical protein